MNSLLWMGRHEKVATEAYRFKFAPSPGAARCDRWRSNRFGRQIRQCPNEAKSGERAGDRKVMRIAVAGSGAKWRAGDGKVRWGAISRVQFPAIDGQESAGATKRR